MLKNVCDFYSVEFEQIFEVYFDNIWNEQDLYQKANENLNPSVSLCFWVLPGKKNAGINYDKIKRFMVNELPVPSQMILTSTI